MVFVSVLKAVGLCMDESIDGQNKLIGVAMGLHMGRLANGILRYRTRKKRRSHKQTDGTGTADLASWNLHCDLYGQHSVCNGPTVNKVQL